MATGGEAKAKRKSKANAEKVKLEDDGNKNANEKEHPGPNTKAKAKAKADKAVPKAAEKGQKTLHFVMVPWEKPEQVPNPSALQPAIAETDQVGMTSDDAKMAVDQGIRSSCVADSGAFGSADA